MLRVPALATAVIAAALAIYWLFALVSGQRKLEQIDPLPAGRGNYRITLRFAPERFHQLVLQDRGRLVEVRGSTVYLMDVPPDALRDIAQRYWVTSVDRWSGR